MLQPMPSKTFTSKPCITHPTQTHPRPNQSTRLTTRLTHSSRVKSEVLTMTHEPEV